MNDTPTSRLELLFDEAAVSRLAEATVVVLGLGGVGSNCLEALVRGGVGNFVLLDGDTVCPSNLNRQAVAWQETIGQKKTDVAAALVHGINPAAQVSTHDTFLLPENAEAFLRTYAHADFIVDAIDTVATKLAVAQAAEVLGLPLVSSMGAAQRLFPERLRFADLYDTSTDPLCRVMRREAKRRGIKQLRVLYSDEAPRKPRAVPEDDAAGNSAKRAPRAEPEDDAASNSGKRAPLGSASWLPAIMGHMIAGYVICNLLNIECEGDVRQ